MSENTHYRKLIYDIVDELNKPENADIKYAFTHFDPTQEGGWLFLDGPPPPRDFVKWYEVTYGRPVPPTAFTSEQIERWHKIVPDEVLGNSGAFCTLIFTHVLNYFNGMTDNQSESEGK